MNIFARKEQHKILDIRRSLDQILNANCVNVLYALLRHSTIVLVSMK